MTELEIKVMNLYARCEMNSINGAVPECADDVYTYIWADERAAALGISEQAVGGVLSNLVSKGFMTVYPDDEGGVASFTEEGFEAWVSDQRADKE